MYICRSPSRAFGDFLDVTWSTPYQCLTANLAASNSRLLTLTPLLPVRRPPTLRALRDGTFEVVKCIICGAPVGGEYHTWLNEFRAVYTNGHEWSNPHLSGVGLRRAYGMGSTQVQAPIDPQQRYDDSGYEQCCPKVSVVGMRPMYESDNLAPPLGDPNNLVQNSSWGYFSHDSCWRSWTEVCYPAEIDVRVLNEFCRSFPSGHGVIDWGHDYGGIFETLSEISPAGPHWLGVLKNIQRRRENHYSADEIYHADPLCIPFLDSLLKETAEKHEEIDIPARFFCPMENSNSQVDTQKDCFEVFPRELRGIILLHLPTEDVRNLFLASRAFASSPISQDFWASRFQQNFEFSSIFESKVSGATSRYRDWRSLFHGLRKVYLYLKLPEPEKDLGYPTTPCGCYYFLLWYYALWKTPPYFL